MTPPITEDPLEDEVTFLQEEESKMNENFILNHFRINKGIYILSFIVLLFFIISLGVFYFQVESFEDNKFKRIKIKHENYSSK